MGYGDISPQIWPSKIVVIFMIFVALAIIPIHIEQIAVLYFEQQRMVDYTDTTAKHVVLCTTELRFDAILDFLNEFYEVDDHQLPGCKSVLILNKVPQWTSRGRYQLCHLNGRHDQG